MDKKPLIVVGIPALDEERDIAKVVVRCMNYANKILVVDDGSQDDTALIAEKLGATVIKHGKNLGKGAALRDCFKWAKQAGADILVTIDGDGQHNPSEIPKLLDAMSNGGGVDVVIGSRISRPQDMPRSRWLGQRALDTASRVKVEGRIVDTQSGFRAYSRKAIENLVAAEVGMGVDSEVLMRAHQAGMRIVEVPITMSYTGVGQSSVNPMVHWLDVMFSVAKFISIRHPLAFYGSFSAAALIVSFAFGAMTLDYYQRWGIVITNMALISVAAGILGFLALFTGLILFTLITVVRERK